MKRLEISLPKELKANFESMAEAISEEFIEPEDRRQRLAKAKVQLIDELTKNINHEFFTLKEKIAKLESMVEFLSPSFEAHKGAHPLPSFVENLSDDPSVLKSIIACLYKDKCIYQLQAKEYKRRSEQYLALYELTSL